MPAAEGDAVSGASPITAAIQAAQLAAADNAGDLEPRRLHFEGASFPPRPPAEGPPSETDSDICLLQVADGPLKKVKAEPDDDDDQDELLCFFVDHKGGPRGPHIKSGRVWLAPGVLRLAVAAGRSPATTLPLASPPNDEFIECYESEMD